MSEEHLVSPPGRVAGAEGPRHLCTHRDERRRAEAGDPWHFFTDVHGTEWTEVPEEFRRLVMEHVKLYHTPLGAQADAQMSEAFERLAESRDESPLLHIEQRELRARRRAGGVVWFDFKTLCGGPRSQNDYLELATQFHTMLLSDVPQMTPRHASEARRFTWLVDVLYDRRVKLIMSAAVPAEQLYIEGPLGHEFPRTVSRLSEMQSARFLALARRDVDTSLT